jgi:hypothetical protein
MCFDVLCFYGGHKKDVWGHLLAVRVPNDTVLEKNIGSNANSYNFNSARSSVQFLAGTVTIFTGL